MIEVYRSTNTNYQKNGDITLTPLECIFEWGLDGICQIELTHEYDDLGRWEYLVNDNVIAAPTPYSDKQLFRIYKREKSDDEVTVYARHIYYDNLGNYLVDVRPTNKNGQQALDIIFSGTKFTPHSDITTANTAYYVRKNIVEAIAGDDENSFINRWGGERLYDNQDVCLLLNISKRTLQRYRDNGLKYHTILHKTYYREKDLHEFIRRYFDGENIGKGKAEECKEDERTEDGMLSDDKNEPTEDI